MVISGNCFSSFFFFIFLLSVYYLLLQFNNANKKKKFKSTKIVFNLIEIHLFEDIFFFITLANTFY